MHADSTWRQRNNAIEGTGSSLEGHVLAVSGGLSLDLSRMDKILEINDDDLDCRVQAGMRRVLTISTPRHAIAAGASSAKNAVARPSDHRWMPKYQSGATGTPICELVTVSSNVIEASTSAAPAR